MLIHAPIASIETPGQLMRESQLSELTIANSPYTSRIPKRMIV